MLGPTLEAAPFCRRKRIDVTNAVKLAQLHSLLPYSYRCVTVAFKYDGWREERVRTLKRRLSAVNEHCLMVPLFQNAGFVLPPSVNQERDLLC